MKRWEAAKKSYVREEVCTVDIWRNGDDEEEERRVKIKVTMKCLEYEEKSRDDELNGRSKGSCN